MNSCLYFGRVFHSRRAPVQHRFGYPVMMTYLDLSELSQVFAGRWAWGVERRAIASFHRTDHFGDPHLPLERCVRELVEERTGQAPRGPIRLLTNLRCWGYCFNPISVYYCFDEGGQRLVALVAEVHNTPWNERHLYVLTPPPDAEAPLRMSCPKAFHVSPFMRTEGDYRWRVGTPGCSLELGITLDDEALGRFFTAGVRLRRAEITTDSLARALVLFPFVTGGVIGRIYWQALRLWLKRVPYVPYSSDRRAQRR